MRPVCRSDMFIHLGIIAFIVIRESNGQERCSTTTETQGVCIRISECDAILNLLKTSNNLQPAQIETLIKSRCGFDGNIPKVCCPNDTQVAEVTNEDSAGSPASKMQVPVPPDVSKHPNLRLINNPGCGETISRYLPGTEAWIGEFPWMALIAYKFLGDNTTEFRCSGSLINERYVLTAAHCVTGLDPGLKLSGVRLREHDLSTELDCDGNDGHGLTCSGEHQDFLIESFHAHDDYQQKKYANDIALIRMDRDVDLDSYDLQPICLPVGINALIKRRMAFATGWGGIETGNNSQRLLIARMDILPIENCTLQMSDCKNIGIDISSCYKQICAVPRDPCAEDRGGPLQLKGDFENLKKFILYGVASIRSDNCADVVRGGDPAGVYTYVSYYMDWILDTMRE